MKSGTPSPPRGITAEGATMTIFLSILIYTLVLMFVLGICDLLFNGRDV